MHRQISQKPAHFLSAQMFDSTWDVQLCFVAKKSSKSSKNDLNTDLCADYWVQMILEVDFVEVQPVLGCPGVDHSEKAFLFLDTDLIS